MNTTSDVKLSPNSLMLHEIRQRVRIGCTPEERAWPQICSFNIELHFDMNTCALSDELSHTIDYMQVLTLLSDLAAEREWRLIESMNASICALLLERFYILQRVSVSVRKVIAENSSGVSCYYQLDRNSSR